MGKKKKIETHALRSNPQRKMKGMVTFTAQCQPWQHTQQQTQYTRLCEFQPNQSITALYESKRTDL